MFRTKSKKVVAAALSALLVMGNVPTAAFAESSAELQVQLDAARATLNDLGNQVQAAGENLYETQYQLEITTQQIADTQASIETEQVQLAGAQEVLGKRVSANYKTGGVSLISLILQSKSFDEFLSNIYYASKVYEQESQDIQQVKDLKNSLEEQKKSLEQYKSEQEHLLETQTVQMEELKQQEAAQAEYVNNLDAEVAAALEAERQAELERQRKEAEEAAARQAAALAAQEQSAAASNQGNAGAVQSSSNGSEAASSQSSSESFSSSTSSSSSSDEEEEEYSDSSSYSYSGSSSSGSSSLSASQRSAIISAAYSQIGVPYVFGACSPGSAFDCSGFTSWCYSQAGLSLPHSAASQSASTNHISYSELQPGDLVFWIGTGDARLTGNHVAIYLGDGMIIHAVWAGVTTQALYSGVTGYGTL